MRRRTALAGVVAAVALGVAATASASPGNGTNALLIFNDCGGTSVTLVSQGKGAFATAHVVASNAPAPLVSLAYVATAEVDGQTVVVDSGEFAHAHPQQGQPLISCTGEFTVGDLTFHIEVTGFFPHGT
jgi:hypothetical protein